MLMKFKIWIFQFSSVSFTVLAILVSSLCCTYHVYICLSIIFSGHSFELQAKVYNVAGDDFRSSILQSIQSWIQVCSAYML